jgi:translocation and assembly module TamA
MRKFWCLILVLLIFRPSLSIAANPFSFLSFKSQIKSSFTGISGDLLNNVQNRVNVIKQSVSKPYTAEEMKNFYESVKHEIPKALEPYGYFKTKITSSKMENIGDNWYATYNIDPGPPVYITKLNITIIGAAANDSDFKAYLANLPLKEGDILNTVKYKQMKQVFFTLAEKNGYLAAKVVDAAINVDLDKDSAEIQFGFDSGAQYLFGPIKFNATTLNTNFLTKFVTFKQGEYYSRDKIQQTQNNLNNSGLFSNVIIDTDLAKAENMEVPIIFQTTPRKKQQYNLGLGYGTDTGIRASAAMDLYNLTSSGHRFNGTFRISFPQIIKSLPFERADTGLEFDLEAHYIIPGKNPLTDQYDITAGTAYINEEFYGSSMVVKAGSGYTTVIGGWQQVLRLNLHYEDWTFTNDDPHNTYGRTILLLPIVSWTKRVTNDTIRPTKGYRVSLMMQGSATPLQDEKLAFLQAKLDAKMIHPIIPNNTLLVLRAAIGDTLVKNAEALPLSFWFASGGADSIRGFDYHSIGPGTQLFEVSMELRQRVYSKFYLAGFVDAGNAGDNIFSSKDQSFLNSILKYRAVGLGIVWLSPIGAIKLYLSDNTTLQFSMGVEL